MYVYVPMDGFIGGLAGMGSGIRWMDCAVLCAHGLSRTFHPSIVCLSFFHRSFLICCSVSCLSCLPLPIHLPSLPYLP